MFNFFNDDFFPDTGFTIFSILPVMFVITFAIIFFIIIAAIVSSLRTNARNNAAPRLKSQAKVVSRRTNVHGMHGGSTSTDYYITFEFIFVYIILYLCIFYYMILYFFIFYYIWNEYLINS